MIFAKNVTPGSVILHQVTLHAVSHCTAPSWEIEMYENPKLSNTARSQTTGSGIMHRVGFHAVWYCAVRKVWLRAVLACSESNIFILFTKTYISMTFRIYVMIFRKNFENILKNPKWLTLRGVQLCAVWYCTESDSAQLNTARIQQLKFTADPKVSNTVRFGLRTVRYCLESDSAQSFARNNFVFACLSLPSMRILNFVKTICVLLQHSPTFFINILKG